MEFIISPSIKEFYGVPADDKILKLAFVFRSAQPEEGKDSYLEGKDVVSGTVSDIFVNVYEQGLNVSFTLPAGNQSVKQGESLDFIVTTSSSATIELLVNSTVVKTEENTESLSHTYIFSSTDDYMVVAKASSDQQTAFDTLYVCVPKPASFETRPSGMKEGINIDQSGVIFVLYAPSKTNIFLAGDFNNWVQLNSYQLKRDGNYWWYTLTNVDKDKLYRFQYIVDDTIRISDPYTELVLDPSGDDWINNKHERYPDLPPYPVGKASGLVGTFRINKPEYKWEMESFKIPSKTNMVIYELLLRDFSPEQSLQGALDRLDYLDKLGITAIELMPVQEFDGNSSWGYNPNHYFAPDKAYGSPEMYKKFIDECHKRGIAVILDVVLNHATGDHPWAKLYWDSENNKTTSENPWFNVDAPHPYSVSHDFNHSKTIVREHFKRMLQYWIEEYKIDGYRVDLSKGLSQRDCEALAKEKGISIEQAVSIYDAERIGYITEYYEAAKEKNPDIMFILEHFCEDSEERELAAKGMYLWRNVNNAFSQSAMGWQENSDFNSMNSSPKNWVGYNESHDEERNFFKVTKYGAGNLQTDSIARIKRVPLNMAFATLIPGPKMIWEFGEIGYDVESGESGSAVRMKEKPSGFYWYHNCEYRREAYYNTAKILNMRKQYPNAFNEGECELNVGYNDWENGRRIAIKHNDLNMVVLGNFKTESAITYPNFPQTGTWYELISEEEFPVSNPNMTIELQAGEVRIFTNRRIPVPGIPELPDPPSFLPRQDKDIYTTVYPTVTNGKIYISTNGNIESAAVYSLRGEAVKVITNGETEMDISELTNGLYFVKLITSNGKSVHKIVKN